MRSMKKSIGAKTLLFPAPVLMVGTYDSGGKPNLMPASWGGICCSDPPCVAIALRAATYTHGNIKAQKAFTISIPRQTQVKLVDYLGMISGRDVDKFAKTGLTPVKAEKVNAPFAAEFPLTLECRLKHTLELGLHTLFVGEVIGAQAETDILDSEGRVDVEKLKPLSFDPEYYRYHGIGGFLGTAFSVGHDFSP